MFMVRNIKKKKKIPAYLAKLPCKKIMVALEPSFSYS